jgi:hypothetical protein
MKEFYDLNRVQLETRLSKACVYAVRESIVLYSCCSQWQLLVVASLLLSRSMIAKDPSDRHSMALSQESFPLFWLIG